MASNSHQALRWLFIKVMGSLLCMQLEGLALPRLVLTDVLNNDHV